MPNTNIELTQEELENIVKTGNVIGPTPINYSTVEDPRCRITKLLDISRHLNELDDSWDFNTYTYFDFNERAPLFDIIVFKSFDIYISEDSLFGMYLLKDNRLSPSQKNKFKYYRLKMPTIDTIKYIKMNLKKALVDSMF